MQEVIIAEVKVKPYFNLREVIGEAELDLELQNATVRRLLMVRDLKGGFLNLKLFDFNPVALF